MKQFKLNNIADKIQFTNVYPDATRQDIVQHCELCLKYNFNAAMIAPAWIPVARDILRNSSVKVATVAAFPNGNETTAMKVCMVRRVFEDGADELDFVPNIGFLLSGMEVQYFEDIQGVVEAAEGRCVKAMLEFGFLQTEDLRRRAARIADEAGVHWVKQSSGWGKGGIPATVEDVRFLRGIVSPRCRVKVSGRVNTLEKALTLLEAGAELIGTSSAQAIMEGKVGEKEAY